MKRNILALCAAALTALLWASCSSYETYADDPYGNFDCLAALVDEHYCFFAEKDVDWGETAALYRARIVPDITDTELFDLMGEMLCELRDGHVNLVSPFNVCYYRRWWTDYPQDFDLRTIQEHYLGFDWNTTCGIIYKILPQNVGYLYYPSFSYTVGEGNLDYILSYLSVCDGLVIDVRDNGGGELTNIVPFVSRFIHEPVTGGYIRHKTGPGHSDFSEPYPVEYKPADSSHIVWDKPVVVLANRSTFSAANDFVSVMKQIPGVRIVGATTGGGGGMPFTYDLPNGWTVRMSVSPMTDAAGLSIESGIEPSEGCAVHSPAAELAEGMDAILDFALSLLTSRSAGQEP